MSECQNVRMYEERFSAFIISIRKIESWMEGK